MMRAVSVIGTMRVLNLRNWMTKDLATLGGRFRYVGRGHPRFPEGSPWRNNFTIGRWGLQAGPMFADALHQALEADSWVRFVRHGTSGVCTEPERSLREALTVLLAQDLGCWCIGDGHRCHGEVLAYAAEGSLIEVARARRVEWWTEVPKLRGADL